MSAEKSKKITSHIQLVEKPRRGKKRITVIDTSFDQRTLTNVI